MERKVVAVCTVVGCLGLLSAALGFVAEAKRIKGSDVRTTIPGECIYPRSPALALGLAAAVALMLAQGIINSVAGCICCKKNQGSSRIKWISVMFSFIISWITFILAFLLFLTGAALNDQHGEEKITVGSYCYVLMPGVFSGGALLSLASVAFGLVHYTTVSMLEHSETWASQQSHGIAMGRAQIPQQSSQPVFVHEDAYNRRQFP